MLEHEKIMPPRETYFLTVTSKRLWKKAYMMNCLAWLSILFSFWFGVNPMHSMKTPGRRGTHLPTHTHTLLHDRFLGYALINQESNFKKSTLSFFLLKIVLWEREREREREREILMTYFISFMQVITIKTAGSWYFCLISKSSLISQRCGGGNAF